MTVKTSTSPSVYLARHGQTASNLERRYAGYSAEPLTGTGREEVAGLAFRLESAGIGEIWTSEIARARESAEIIAEILKVQVVADRRLSEMRLGPWEGLTEDEVARLYPREYDLWLTRPDLVQLDGRETLQALATRIVAVIAEANAIGRPVLLMTHVAPIRVAALHSLGLPLRLYKRIPVENADCFAIGSHRGELRRLGDGASFRTDLERAATAERVS